MGCITVMGTCLKRCFCCFSTPKYLSQKEKDIPLNNTICSFFIALQHREMGSTQTLASQILPLVSQQILMDRLMLNACLSPPKGEDKIVYFATHAEHSKSTELRKFFRA